MMTVYIMVMTLCTGGEGCVEERKPEPTFATKALCMESARAMAPRKGVKFKCRTQRLMVPNQAPPAESVVSAGAKGRP